MLPELHKLLRLYLTMPVTTVTSERSFSALKRLLTYMYLWATMTNYTYNIKKLQMISILFQVSQNFVDANDECKKYLGSFSDWSVYWMFIYWLMFFLAILTTLHLLYIQHCDSIINVHWLNAYCTLWLFTIIPFTAYNLSS